MGWGMDGPPAPTPGGGYLGEAGGPPPPAAQEAVAGAPTGLKTFSPKTDAYPLWPRRAGWARALRKALGTAASSPSVDTVCLLVLHGLGVCRVTFGRVGSRGSYLYSESPIIFSRIIWKSMKERHFSSSKCLTQSKGENKWCGFRFPLSGLLPLGTTSPPLPPSRSLVACALR